MATVWTKGQSFSASYDSAEYPVLSDDWTGTAELFAQNRTTATDSWTLTRSGNVMLLNIPVEDINSLELGVYQLKALFTSSVLGISVGTLEYVTVVGAATVGGAMTTLTMTISKIDGTPTGRETRTLVNTSTGTQIVLGWQGVTVTASHPVADELTGVIIGTETISTTTNAAGYAQLSVIKGQTVTVSCPSFGKTVTIDTTGQDTIDLSSYF